MHKPLCTRYCGICSGRQSPFDGPPLPLPEQCSHLLSVVWAGVAHNKILAKLASGMHKPMQQTVVPSAATASLLHDLPIPKLRQLGGKFGEEIMSSLNISTVGRLSALLELKSKLKPSLSACTASRGKEELIGLVVIACYTLQ